MQESGETAMMIMNVTTPLGYWTEDSDDGMEEVRDRRMNDWKGTELYKG